MAANPGDLPIDPNVVDGTELAARLNRILPDVATLEADKVSKYGDTMTGDLTFSGNGRRIKINSLSGTRTQRTLITEATPDSSVNMGIIPSGVGKDAYVTCFNSNDADNSSFMQIGANASSATVRSSGVGTSSALPMTFEVNSAERMRIDTDGKITTGALLIDGGNISNKNSTGDAFLGLYGSAKAASGSAGIILFGDAHSLKPNFLTFVNNNFKERMAIQDTGVVVLPGIDASPSRDRFIVEHSAGNAGELANFRRPDGDSCYATISIGTPGSRWSIGKNANDPNFIFATNGTQKGYVDWNTGVYTATSDRRVKKNIEPCKYGLDAVMALEPVQYHMKDESGEGAKHIGLIAQDVKAVIDEAVDIPVDPKQPWGLAVAGLVPVLINAIKELKAEVDDLRAQVAAGK